MCHDRQDRDSTHGDYNLLHFASSVLERVFMVLRDGERAKRWRKTPPSLQPERDGKDERLMNVTGDGSP
jgi:hypothetical protein